MKAALLCACLLASAWHCAAEPRRPDKPPAHPSFLIPGDYHEEEATRHVGSGWLALAPMGKRWELFPTAATSTRVKDEIVDEGTRRTGVRIASSRKNAIALVRLSTLAPGPVAVADIRIPEGGLQIDAGKPVEIRFNDASYRIGVVGNQIFLSKNGQRTVFKDLKVQPQVEEGARLEWAGDLDGDGELDVMMGYFVNNGSGSCLYLSSLKTPGNLIKQLACHGGVGC